MRQATVATPTTLVQRIAVVAAVAIVGHGVAAGPGKLPLQSHFARSIAELRGRLFTSL